MWSWDGSNLLYAGHVILRGVQTKPLYEIEANVLVGALNGLPPSICDPHNFYRTNSGPSSNR